MATVQFVDRIDAAPTVRLDLNTFASGLMVGVAGIDFSPPPVRRSVAGTLLGDGERIPAWAYGNRVLKVPVQVVSATAAGAAGALASLARELTRPANVLRVRLDGMATYTFYRTLPAPDYTLALLRLLAAANTTATLEIPAEPFGYGLPVTAVNAATVNNDPASPVAVGSSKLSTLDSGVEASLGGWTAPDADQTVARSTAQAHGGAASVLVTAANTNTSEARLSPYAGASTSDHTCMSNTPHVVSGWARAVGTGRTMQLRVAWYTSADAFISFSDISGGPDVSSGWTQVTGTAWSPATAAKWELYGQTLTPIAAEGHYWDDLTLSPATPGNVLDVTGVTGDVETPAKIQLSSGGANMAPVIGVRQHGVPSDITPVVQCEHMVQGTDTTTGTDAAMSNGQRSRTTFGTIAMATRLTATLPYQGGLPRTAARGTYRLFAVVASSASGSTYALRWRIVSQFGGAIQMAAGNPVTYVATGTGRQVVDLDLFQVPAGRDPVYDGYGAELPVGTLDVQLQAQRVSGTGSLDWDYAVAVPADEALCALATTYLDVILDGATDTVWTPGGFGEVTAAAVPAVGATSQTIMLQPGQTNRLYVLRPDGVGTGAVRGADVKSRTATVTVSYWPRTLTWFG